MDETGFVKFVETFGWKAGVAVVLMAAVRYLVTKVIEPWTARQIRFFDDLDKAFERQTVAIETLGRTCDTIRLMLSSQEKLLERLDDEHHHRAGRPPRAEG